MNESKHTPGPWKVAEIGSNLYVQTRSGETDVALVYRPYPADGESGKPEDMMQRRAVHARLIAASPTLYEAAQYALTTLESGEWTGAKVDQAHRGEAIRMLKEAIAQATATVD